MDVLSHYGRASHPWEVCVHVMTGARHVELGCGPPESPSSIGGHVVAIVEEAYLVDASLGQVADQFPDLQVPQVFIGELLPRGAPLQNMYLFPIPAATVHYEARPVTTRYQSSPDWGPSPEREISTARIITQIDGYCQAHGIM